MNNDKWICKVGIHNWTLYCNMLIHGIKENWRDRRWGCIHCGKVKTKLTMEMRE